MLPFRHWLRRADLRNDPRTVALVLPDGMSLAYADLAATADDAATAEVTETEGEEA